MSSVLNQTKRIYSIAFGALPKERLKLFPGMTTWENCKQLGFNKQFSTEGDFEDAIEAISKLDYVRVLQDLGRLVLSLKRNTHLEEPPEEEEPKVKRHRRKKKEENPFE